MEGSIYQQYVHYYHLKRLNPANSQTVDFIQNGALLKLEDPFDGAWGVADICPWPSLGDLTLAEEIIQRGPLFKRAYELAKKDLQARRAQKRLVEANVIKNHFLITDYKNLNLKEFNPYVEVVKVKADANTTELINFLIQIESSVEKIRLDFNFSLSESEFEKFIENCSAVVLKKIDVIEDPFPFDPIAWKKCNQKVKLALDWSVKGIEGNLTAEQNQWPHRIFKPAREELLQFEYMTSSMDHPVGVAHALVYAQNHQDNVHGLQTLSLYEKTEFHTDFEISKNNELIYKPEGYGIGFASQLAKLSWVPLVNWEVALQQTAGVNQIYLNPRFSQSERATLFELKKVFESEVANTGFVFIASSGSSQSINDSVKLIALPFSALLNSAARVNSYYNLNHKMKWGCVLPTFHVGGLGICIRAALAKSNVYFADGVNFSLDWITEKNIQLLSLVPAQAYDILLKNWRAPKCLRQVFIGGAALNEATTRRMLELGWPLQITYGMTETASMVAVKKDPLAAPYTLFPGVHVNSEKTLLCDSLAEYSVQKISNQIQIQKLKSNNGFTLPDEIEILAHDSQSFILKGRKGEVVKVLGEGVSLNEVRDRLESALVNLKLSPLLVTVIAQVDERKGFELVMVLESSLMMHREQILDHYNVQARPYEKIQKIKEVQRIPRTSLGKIQYNLLC